MERNFKDVVENIRGAEKDVDKVLDAARLERHEGPNRHMTGEQKLILLLSLIAAGTFLTLLLAPHTVIEGGPHGKQILP